MVSERQGGVGKLQDSGVLQWKGVGLVCLGGEEHCLELLVCDNKQNNF